MSLTYRDANEQNNQQADRHRDGNQVLFQRLKVVKMKINGEADQHDIVLFFSLQCRRAGRGDNPVCFHLHVGPGVHRLACILHRPEKDILRAAMGAEIRGIHRWPDGLAL